MDQRLTPALRESHHLLSETGSDLQLTLRFALVDGLAVSTWGAVRATLDIDIIADCEPSPIRNHPLRGKIGKSLEHRNCSFQWCVGDYDDPIPLLLRVELSPAFRRVGVDILWADKLWHREAVRRAIGVEIDGTEIPVLHPEDLILMKLEAGGPQDLLDVLELLSASSLHLDVTRLKGLATRLRLEKVLGECLRAARKR